MLLFWPGRPNAGVDSCFVVVVVRVCVSGCERRLFPPPKKCLDDESGSPSPAMPGDNTTRRGAHQSEGLSPRVSPPFLAAHNTQTSVPMPHSRPLALLAAWHPPRRQPARETQRAARHRRGPQRERERVARSTRMTHRWGPPAYTRPAQRATHVCGATGRCRRPPIALRAPPRG
jgi:hypothetical protein